MATEARKSSEMEKIEKKTNKKIEGTLCWSVDLSDWSDDWLMWTCHSLDARKVVACCERIDTSLVLASEGKRAKKPLSIMSQWKMAMRQWKNWGQIVELLEGATKGWSRMKARVKVTRQKEAAEQDQKDWKMEKRIYQDR